MTSRLSHACPLDILYAVNVSRVFCASCSITRVRPRNAITHKASDSSILCLPPSSSPTPLPLLFFSCLSKRKQFGGLSRCGADSWHFSQPCQGSSTVPVVMQQNTPEMSRRKRDILASVCLTHMPQSPRIHFPDMLEVWYLWTFLYSS